MKLSETSEQSVQSAFGLSSAVYTLISFYMPFSVLICALLLIDRLISKWLPNFAMPYLPIAIASLISALVASAYIAFIKHDKSSHSAGDIRGAIIMAALAYLLSSLLRFDKPFQERFFPWISNILPTLCALYVWIQVIILRRMFAARETFEYYTETYDGEQLQQIIHEDEDMMVSTNRMIQKYRLIHTVQLVFILILSCVCAALRIRVPIPLFVFLIILVISTALIFALFGVFNREQYYAGEGVSLSAPQRSKRLFAMLLFTCAVALLSVILASNTSLLPFSLITSFLAWLLSLFPKASRVERPSEPLELGMPDMGMGGFSLPEELMVDENYKPSPFWDYIQYAALALLIIGFLWFMVKPLLTRSDKDAPFLKRLKRLLAEWFNTMKAAVASFIASFRHDAGIRLAKTSAEAIRRLETSLLEGYSAAKRRDIKRSVSLFVRLIVWGSEACQVSWKPSRAPGEYCAILAAAAAPLFPQLQFPILRCGDLFERALYAKEPLSEEEREEFAARVEEITTSEKLLTAN
jgi:ABC-type multidrug transport system fused ATPase/permease subunit